MLTGILIGAAIVGAAWKGNEIRWRWKISERVHEFDDPEDPLLMRHSRKH